MRRPRSSAFIGFDGWLWPAIVPQTDGFLIAFDSNPAYTLRLGLDHAIWLNGCDGALFLGELERVRNSVPSPDDADLHETSRLDRQRLWRLA